jgi:hypothetical protein
MKGKRHKALQGKPPDFLFFDILLTPTECEKKR